jgi:predicted nucleic-acid-binding protein
MIAIDSNVLIRLVVGDDAAQAMRARTVLSAAVGSTRRIFVSLTVILETVWAIRQTYKRPKSAVLEFLRALIDNAAIQMSDRDLIVRSFDLYSRQQVDFADCVIALAASDHGAFLTYSFDADGVKAGLFAAVE